MVMTLDYSVMIQNMVIPNIKDPRSFFIPCHIGTMDFERDLCDLGDSISLMPLSVSKKLDMGDLKPTNVSLQLVDRSVKYPIGMLEDIPVRVGEYYMPVDFIIMDIDEDCQILIILGIPFLERRGHHRSREGS